jgi:hypothetical protein
MIDYIDPARLSFKTSLILNSLSICYHTQQVFILCICMFLQKIFEILNVFIILLQPLLNSLPSLFWLSCHVWWLRHSCFKYSCSVWRAIWHASQQCFSLQRLLCIVSFMLKVKNLSQAFHVKSKQCFDVLVQTFMFWWFDMSVSLFDYHSVLWKVFSSTYSVFVTSAVENEWISAVSIEMINKSTNKDTERTDEDCRVENLKHHHHATSRS